VNGTVRIVPAGDSALVVEYDARIDAAVNARAIALAAAVQAMNLPGIRDVVPTYRSVTVYFDPLRTDYERLLAHLESRSRDAPDVREAAGTVVRIPVCYGGELGPDLDDVAAFASAAVEDVIQLHTAATYRVFMLGFVAGFAYMGSVDERIAMPRHAAPRVRVPLGSVGIAGIQTGVYPAETPGGWRLIGRTPLKPFDPERAEPFLMKAGDAVRFYAITRVEYDAWRSS
jgi:inhibitor of KinA